MGRIGYIVVGATLLLYLQMVASRNVTCDRLDVCRPNNLASAQPSVTVLFTVTSASTFGFTKAAAALCVLVGVCNANAVNRGPNWKVKQNAG